MLLTVPTRVAARLTQLDVTDKQRRVLEVLAGSPKPLSTKQLAARADCTTAPISTLRKPLESVNLKTKQPESAEYERSDVCAVSAASVIVENVVAFEIAAALIEKFGGDSLPETRGNYQRYMERIERLKAKHEKEKSVRG